MVWMRACRFARVLACLGALGALGCAGKSGGDTTSDVPPAGLTAGPPNGQLTAGAPAGMMSASAPASGAAGMTAPPPVPASPGGAPQMPAAPVGGDPPSMEMPPDPAVPGPSGGPTSPPTAAGPQDGDPSRPIVAVPGISCGANPSLFGLTSTNTSIGGRDVHVAYPCNKHAGAPVTFILNLHGTMPSEELKLYQVAYFSANNFVNSHNLITVAPKSVVSQWGNGDGGVDEPHLLEVIDWVYSTFAEFDIRAMWVGGHSWGSSFTARFGCSAAIADKVRGLVLMSGAGVGGFGGAACADRVSVVVTMAEGDGRMPSDQMSVATAHGCDAAQTSMILNNVHTLWPNCDPHYVHGNYYMLGKQHADYMDGEVVESIVDLINLARP